MCVHEAILLAGAGCVFMKMHENKGKNGHASYCERLGKKTKAQSLDDCKQRTNDLGGNVFNWRTQNKYCRSKKCSKQDGLEMTKIANSIGRDVYGLVCGADEGEMQFLS